MIQVNPDGGGDDDGRRGQSEAVRIALLKERVICGTADDKQSLVAQSFRWGTDVGPPEPTTVLFADEILLDGRVTHHMGSGWFALDVDSKSPFFLVRSMGDVFVKSTGRF